MDYKQAILSCPKTYEIQSRRCNRDHDSGEKQNLDEESQKITRETLKTL